MYNTINLLNVHVMNINATVGEIEEDDMWQKGAMSTQLEL